MENILPKARKDAHSPPPLDAVKSETSNLASLTEAPPVAAGASTAPPNRLSTAPLLTMNGANQTSPPISAQTEKDGARIPDAQTFAFSRFTSKNDNAPKREVCTWPDLCELLKKRRKTRDASDTCKDGAAFSGATYPPGATRGNQNAQAVTLAILDFDGGATLPQIEVGIFALNSGDGAAAFVYSTFSHDPQNGKEKYRLVLPLASPVAVSDWPEVWQRLALAFDGAPDRSAKDAARLHFLPSCPKEFARVAVALELPGAPLDVGTLPLLPLKPQKSPETGFFASLATSGDKYAQKAFDDEIKQLCATGSHRNDALNRSAIALGHFVGAGRLNRSEVETALLDASHANGYITKDGEGQTRATIKSGLDAGEKEPNFKGLSKNPREVGASAISPSNAEMQPTPAPIAFKFSTDSDLDACLSDISWLWPGYIPNGFPTMLISEQEMGKSSVAQDLARTLINGGQWPDGQEIVALPDDQKLLWIDTEGTLALFRQRLKDWGMPRGRFILPEDPLKEVMLDNARDWQWIEAAIEHFSPPLIVIDALSGSHSGEENSNDTMKLILKRMAELTQRRKIAAVIIHHLNKAPFGVPEYPITLARVRGAGTITQFCRSVLALGVPDKSNPESRRLDVIKMNLARKPAPVGYALTNTGPVWGDAPEMPLPRRAIDDARDFLLDILANGLVPTIDVYAEAEAKGVGVNSLKDAKKALNIKAHREGGKDGRWFWALPQQNATKEVA